MPQCIPNALTAQAIPAPSCRTVPAARLLDDQRPTPISVARRSLLNSTYHSGEAPLAMNSCEAVERHLIRNRRRVPSPSQCRRSPSRSRRRQIGDGGGSAEQTRSDNRTPSASAAGARLGQGRSARGRSQEVGAAVALLPRPPPQRPTRPPAAEGIERQRIRRTCQPEDQDVPDDQVVGM